MRERYDRRSDAALRLLIVVVCCFVAGLVIPVSCRGQTLGWQEGGNTVGKVAQRPGLGGVAVVVARRLPIGCGPEQLDIRAGKTRHGLVRPAQHRSRQLSGVGVPVCDRVQDVAEQSLLFDVLKFPIPPNGGHFQRAGADFGKRNHALNIAPNAPNFKPDGTQFSPRLLAIPVAAVWGASVYAIHADREWHHEYIGAALLLSRRRWVQWVGLGIMADDAMQHLIQTRRPNYRSPLHKAYAVTLYRWVR